MTTDEVLFYMPFREAIRMEEQVEQVTETKPQVVYSATEIHMAFTLMALAYMKEWKSDVINEKEMKRNQMLKELGFTSSKSFQDSEEAIAPSVKRKVFNWYSERFPNCLFLKVKDFVALLQIYNLVCGELEAYKGEIPDENLEEIITVKETLEKCKNENTYSNKYTDENTIEIAEWWGGCRPRSCKYLYSEGEWGLWNRLTEDEYDNLIDKNGRYPFYGNDLKQFDNTELFIAAPAQDMEGRISDFHIKSEDPFVFQLFPYGVVIYSKWGDEANDPMLEENKL